MHGGGIKLYSGVLHAFARKCAARGVMYYFYNSIGVYAGGIKLCSGGGFVSSGGLAEC